MKKLITLISLVCILFIGGAAPIIASEIDFERNQLFAANDDNTHLNVIQRSVKENFEDIEIEIQLNSGLGKDDWNTHQQFSAGAEFQYRVQISNFSNSTFNSDLLLQEFDSDCVRLKNARIQNVSLEMSDHNFLIPASFLEYGEQIIMYVEAEYVSGGEKCASSLTIGGVSEDFSEFRIESNDVVLGRGGCEEVEVVIDSIYSNTGWVCCFKLQLRNNFSQTNVFNNIMITEEFLEHLGFTQNHFWIYNNHDPNMLIFDMDGFASPIPNTDSILIPLVTICIREEIEYGIEFNWRMDDSIICTTTLFLDCGTTSSDEYISSIEDLTVYPNPANSLLNIQVERDMQNANATIYSSDGKRVHATNLNFISKTATLDIGNLANGLYILQLQTEDGETEMIKFVKME